MFQIIVALAIAGVLKPADPLIQGARFNDRGMF